MWADIVYIIRLWSVLPCYVYAQCNIYGKCVLDALSYIQQLSISKTILSITFRDYSVIIAVNGHYTVFTEYRTYSMFVILIVHHLNLNTVIAF